MPLHDSNTPARGQRFGLSLALLGALLITPDTLLIRLSGLEGWSLSAWRGSLIGSSMMLVWMVMERRTLGRDIKQIASAPVLTIIVASILNTLSFNFAAVETSITVVLTAIATAPLLAAGLSYFVLREATSRLTWAAIALSLVGVLIVIMNGHGATLAPAGNPILGGIYGVFSAFWLAVVFVWSRRHPDIPVILGVAIGTLCTGAIGLIGVPPGEFLSGNMVPILLMGLVVMPAALVCLTIAPRYTSATSVSLLILLEMVLGPIWVWIGTGERPNNMMIVGTALVLATMIAYIIYSRSEHS